MIRPLAVLTALAAMCVCTPSAATAQGGFQAAPNLSGLMLDLDSKEGTASSFDIPNACGLNAVRTRLSMPRIGLSSRWLPVATIRVMSGESWVGLSIGGNRTFPMNVRVIASGGATDQLFARQMQTSETADVAVDWTPEGVVTIAVWGETLTAKLPGPPTGVEFSSSTAQAKFAGLSIGRTTAAVVECPVG